MTTLFDPIRIGDIARGRRLREDASLHALDAATLYGGGAAGYTDYPALDAAMA